MVRAAPVVARSDGVEVGAVRVCASGPLVLTAPWLALAPVVGSSVVVACGIVRAAVRASMGELTATAAGAHRGEEDRRGRIVRWGGGIAASCDAARAVVRVEGLVVVEPRGVGTAADERSAKSTVFVRAGLIIGSSRVGTSRVQAVERGNVGVRHVVDCSWIETADHRVDAAAWQVGCCVVVERGRLEAARVAARAIVMRRGRTVVVCRRARATVDDFGALAIVIGGVGIVRIGAAVSAARDGTRAVVDDKELAVVDGGAVSAA